MPAWGYKSFTAMGLEEKISNKISKANERRVWHTKRLTRTQMQWISIYPESKGTPSSQTENINDQKGIVSFATNKGI